MIRLLAFTDDPALPSGYGNVARHVLKPLADSGAYEIHICANGYRGDSHDPVECPYRYYIPQLSKEGDPYGFGRVRELIGRIRPHVVYMQTDLHVIAAMFKAAPQAFHHLPVVAYTLVDGDPFPDAYLDGVRQCAQVIVPTQYAKRVITEMDADLGDRVQVLPYGHDGDVFRPLAETKAESKQIAAASMRGVDPDWFIVLRVDKNQERKQWPATLRIFGEFAQDKPEARLWIHSHMLSEYGYDMPALIERYGLRDQVLNSGLTAHHHGVPGEALNRIYNVADVHLSTSAGGGWELSTHEAKAAGTVPIVTDYAAMSEVGQGGVLVPTTGRYTTRHTVDWGLIDEGAAAAELEVLYRCPDLYARQRWQGLSWAQGMTWQAIRPAEQFDALVREVIDA